MRILLAAILLASAGWGGYWFLGAQAVERGAAAWVEQSHATGLLVRHEGLTVSGFPGSFYVRMESPQLLSLWNGTGWQAGAIELFASSFRPNRLSLVLQEQQRLVLRHETLDLDSEDLRAGVWLSGTSLALAEASLAGVDLVLGSDASWRVTLDSLELSLRQDSQSLTRHDLSFEARGLVPDPVWHATIALDPSPPPAIEHLSLKGGMEFDAPLDRHALAGPAPRLTRLQIDEASIRWGEMLLWGDGEVAVDADGFPQGRITFRARNWKQMLAVAVAAGLLHPEVAPTWERGMQMLEDEGDTPGTLEVPLRFDRGRMSLGPLPLGPAPRLTGG
jgi:hypothetical protein